MSDLTNEMFTLAAIAYCGYNLILPEPLKQAHLRRAMTELLHELEQTVGKWEIVWGPASVSGTSPGFDDVAMYVAKRQENGSRPLDLDLAIAIRGTNPISLTDWVFGDLLVTEQKPWNYGAPPPAGAKISSSTALGLEVLQSIVSKDPAPTPGATASTSSAQPSTVGDQSPVPTSILESVETRAMALRARLSSLSGTSLPRSLSGKSIHFADTLKQQTAPESNSDSGNDLISFLREKIDAANGTVNLYVTGHSKGGALTSALALWLEDTRGDWANNNVTVQAYSFAGPTAGNKEFAGHLDSVLGNDHHRVVNPFDLVPHVWADADLQKIPDLYPLEALEKDLLLNLVNKIRGQVQSLDYCQPSGPTVLNVSPPAELPLLVQLVHQHLEGYIEGLGLSGQMSTATFFTPVL